MTNLLTTWESPQHGTLTVHYHWLRSRKEQENIGKMSLSVQRQSEYRERQRRKKEENQSPWTYPTVTFVQKEER
jgi:hypothetical protein